MTLEPSRPLLAANWKMNPVTRADAVELARDVAPAAGEHADLVEVAYVEDVLGGRFRT